MFLAELELLAPNRMLKINLFLVAVVLQVYLAVLDFGHECMLFVV